MPAPLLNPHELSGDLSELRAMKREATQHLLGETIRVSDADW